MLTDTSDIHAFSAAQHRQATDLTAVATELAAARVPAEAFGSVGVRFVSALNAALTQQAQRVTHIADRLTAAGSTAQEAADAYLVAERAVAQTMSIQGG
jgi:Holliday junction resolvasome RuvABC ATP-dependent DNA helicase subunit